MYVEMALDNLLDPDGNILPIAWLDHGPPSRMNWHPRASGISIPYDVAAELEKGWARITGTG